MQQSERTLAYDIAEITEFRYYSGDPIDSAIKCNKCKNSPDKSWFDESCGWEGHCKESEHLEMFEVKKKTYCECCPGFYGDSC